VTVPKSHRGFFTRTTADTSASMPIASCPVRSDDRPIWPRLKWWFCFSGLVFVAVRGSYRRSADLGRIVILFKASSGFGKQSPSAKIQLKFSSFLVCL